MPFVQYEINFDNFEEQNVNVRIQDQDGPADAVTTLQASDEALPPVVMESVNTDDDKTTSIKPKRLRIGFNSDDDNDVRTFSDGGDDKFLVVLITGGIAAPFIGNLTLDDNQEAFQPRPNPVQLVGVDGLNSLSNIELKTWDGEIAVGHFSIIEFVSMCLSNLAPGQQVRVVMNLYEKTRFRFLSANFNITATDTFRIPYEHLGFLEVGDTIEITDSDFNDGSYTIIAITPNPTTSIDIQVSTSTFVLETSEVYIFRSNGHTFSDIFLDALTFEEDIDVREDCLTVLTKILDAFGCFITYDSDGWYIIRWDEYDGQAAISTMKAAVFDADTGDFQTYEDLDLNKVIAHDEDVLYEGYRLSNDNALRRFQRKAKSINHVYKYETPKEIPCNSAFTRGELSATQPVDPLERNYDYECWTMYKGLPPVTNNGTSYIRVVTDAGGYETDRYVLFEVQPDFTTTYYIESEPIFVNQFDKINVSVDVKHNDQVETADTGFSYVVMIVKLYGDDGTYYKLDGGSLVRDGGTWVVSDSTFFTGVNSSIDRIFNGTYDDTTYDNVTLQNADSSDPIPKSGYIRIVLMQSYRVDTYETHFSNLKVEYIPYIDKSYTKIIGQQTKITDSNTSRINKEKQMFISDSPKKLFKGAMKKFDGTNYVLTETWNYLTDTTVLPDSRMSLFILYQWWNQFRKTRTVIESDFQGINSSDEFGIPGLIYRWKINHEDETNKYWMLTSLRDLNFRTCGWAGVLVETSSADGDRIYTDTFEFKYIQ